MDYLRSELNRFLVDKFIKRVGIGAVRDQPIAYGTGAEKFDEVLETARYEIGVVDSLASGREEQRHRLADQPGSIGSRAVEIHQAIEPVNQAFDLSREAPAEDGSGDQD